MEIGPAIRKLREAKRLTLNRVARESGVDQGSLSRFERGLEGVSIENLVEIAKAIDLPLSQICRYSELREETPAQTSAKMDLIAGEIRVLLSQYSLLSCRQRAKILVLLKDLIDLELGPEAPEVHPDYKEIEKHIKELAA